MSGTPPDPKDLLAARDSGRSWSEIAERNGMTVPEVKAAIAEIKAERRKKMSQSPAAEGRLKQRCLCRHTRLEHGEYGDHTGQCVSCGPERVLYVSYPTGEPTLRSEARPDHTHWHAEHVGCNKFTEPIPYDFSRYRRKLRVISMIDRRRNRGKL